MIETSAQPIVIPVGDPNVIRSIQYFLDLAKEGKINGVAIVAITPNGDVYSNPTLPLHPGVLHLALGALSSLTIDINDMLRQFKQRMSASPIIKPNGLAR
jgi:hypothetical protein